MTLAPPPPVPPARPPVGTMDRMIDPAGRTRENPEFGIAPPVPPAQRAQVDQYLKTLDQLEPVARNVEEHVSLASIAVSMKRIAGQLEGNPKKLGFLDHLHEIMQDAARSFNR